MPGDHIFRQIDADLEEIGRLIGRMWSQVDEQWEDALRVLHGEENGLAARADGRERSIEALTREIERATTRGLALRQPVAEDLRFIIASLRISIDLERIGEYAANIVRRAGEKRIKDLAATTLAVQRMGDVVRAMLARLRRAYADRNRELAEECIGMDDEINFLFERVLTDMRSKLTGEHGSVEASTELLFVAKSLERSGDHAKNIARHIYYLATGILYQERQGPSCAP